MNESETDKLMKLLKEVMPPVEFAEPRRELWPAMERRLAERGWQVAWWEWALLAWAIALFCLFPGTIPTLLYHL